MESFDSYAGGEDDIANTRPFDNDGYMGFDPRLPSQRFDSFRMPEHYTQEDRQDRESGGLDEEDEFGARKEHSGSSGPFDAVSPDAPPPYHSSFEDELGDGQSPSMSSTFGHQSFESRLEPDLSPADDFSSSLDSNGNGLGHGHDDSFSHSEGFSYGYPPPADFHNGGAVLPPPDEMQPEEGFILREWKRKNAIHLEEKARIEREQLAQIIDAADSFKDAFYEKRRAHCEATKKNNRDKEKVFLENHKNFHANAHQHYWKAVAELIPHELPAMEVKSRGKKDQKKPAVVINHGPKPGKATDLTRMRQVLVKLKHNLPAHMKAPAAAPAGAPPAPPAGGTGAGDAKVSAQSAAGTSSTPESAPLEKQGSIPTAAVA